MKQNKLGYAHGKIVDLYIVYELKNRRIDSPDFTVQNGLFGAVKITENANTSHYKYEGFGICFDGESSFSFGNRVDAKNVIIFGVNTSNSSHSTNKTQNIYVLGTIYAEKIYKTNFTEQSKKFVLSLHYDGGNSNLFVNESQELKFNHLSIICQKFNHLTEICYVLVIFHQTGHSQMVQKLDYMEMFMTLLLIMLELMV